MKWPDERLSGRLFVVTLAPMKTMLLSVSALAWIEWPVVVAAPWLEATGLGLAALGLAHYGQRLGRWLPMRWWARTHGRILGVDLRKSRRRESDGSVVYEPVIRYAYQVGDRLLEGRRITLESTTGALTWGLKMLNTFRPGAEVPVWYHPGNPTEAVLQPASVRGHALGLAVCGALTLLLLWRLVG